MGPTEHCKRSPSKAESWINCPPSLMAGEAIEEPPSKYAEDGTASHALGEWKGKKALKIKAGRRPTSDYHTDEMEEYTTDYAEYLRDLVAEIKKKCKAPVIMFEQHVALDDPDIFGTCDFMVVAYDELYIVDFKYGYLEVKAEGNFQLMIYALCALNGFNCLYDIARVHFTIFQPRIQNVSTWEVNVETLYSWKKEVLQPAAELADKGGGEFNPGPWCTHNFCKCRNVCRARVDQLLEVAKYEFSEPALLTDEEILDVMSKADDLSKWCSEIMAYAQARAIEGKKWPGYKIVEGRSVRKFSDEAAVEDAAKKAGYTEIYQPKALITLTAMEKLMGKDKFKEILGEYVTRTQGKLALVPESDSRPEVVIASVDQDFTE